jgi:hypothetical protein
MYRACIFCSAALGSNESIERFPVGRTLAFDAAKGRLWAVCPKCARWNLAPIEERWEAIDDAERLFRDTRLRVQSENVGLAKLGDGTRLIRVGRAVEGEMAAWRYGTQLVRRRGRHLATGAGLAVAGAGVALAGAAMASAGGAAAWWMYARVIRPAWEGYRGREAVFSAIASHGESHERVIVFRSSIAHSRLARAADGSGIEVHVPDALFESGARRLGFYERREERPLVLGDASARRMLPRAMVRVNERGAGRRTLRYATTLLQRAGAADALVLSVARQGLALHGGKPPADPRERRWTAFRRVDEDRLPNPVVTLALEMALHEESERRAMDGELAELEAMWREAEEIAAIADRLPDALDEEDR